jgi:ABC-type amino acid transport system permease subunit
MSNAPFPFMLENTDVLALDPRTAEAFRVLVMAGAVYFILHLFAFRISDYAETFDCSR